MPARLAIIPYCYGNASGFVRGEVVPSLNANLGGRRVLARAQRASIEFAVDFVKSLPPLIITHQFMIVGHSLPLARADPCAQAYRTIAWSQSEFLFVGSQVVNYDLAPTREYFF